MRELLKTELERAGLAIPEKYARPETVILVCGEPNLENGQLTPTMKLVRSRILSDYAPETAGLFSAGSFGRCAGTQVMRLQWNSKDEKPS